MKKIFLSPSNQDDNRYAYGDTTEDVQCGRIANACKAALERCGFTVKLEQYDTMQNRVAHSNAWGADMHIPIHTNAYNGTVGGTRIFYWRANGYGDAAARCVYDALKDLTPGTSDNLTANPGLYELSATEATAVYVEAEFHDVPEYARWIIEHVADIGEAICKGVCAYYGAAYIAPGGAAPAPAEPAPEKPTLYRVRKSWADAASQLGAFAQLENAKRLADQNAGYCVFDEGGNAVYTPEQKPQTYTVQKGDSLWTIAERQLGNGLRYPEIMRLNGLNSTTIYAGQTLEIPEK